MQRKISILFSLATTIASTHALANADFCVESGPGQFEFSTLGADPIFTVTPDDRVLLTATANDDICSGSQGPARQLADGRYVFTGDFLRINTLSGDQRTNFPGWRTAVTADGAHPPAGYDMLLFPSGSLQFWNGSEWVGTMPAGERIRILGSPIATVTEVTEGGIAGDAFVFIKESTASDIHAHRFFELTDATGTPFAGAAVGAYAFTARLGGDTDPDFTPMTPSEEFLLAFNYGLSDGEFDAAVAALATPAPPAPVRLPMPLPGLVAMFALMAIAAGVLHVRRAH